MTAKEVKDALRKRHPAFEPGFVGVGRWTCIEEWENIDLLALDAWRSADVIGYEVKVSRSDMRSELLKPSKRAAAVAMCTRFYFAVPAGMLTPAEREWEEPVWEPGDFDRAECTNPDCRARHTRRGFARHAPKPRGSRLRGTDREGVSIHLGFGVDRGVHPGGGTYSHSFEITACCVVCGGRGTVAKSKVESLAPTLWVPRDVGLVVVGPRGCTVLKQAPLNKLPEPILPWTFAPPELPARARHRMTPENLNRIHRQHINQLVRWVSARPDPRHLKLQGDELEIAEEISSPPELPDEPDALPGGIVLG